MLLGDIKMLTYKMG